MADSAFPGHKPNDNGTPASEILVLKPTDKGLGICELLILQPLNFQ